MPSPVICIRDASIKNGSLMVKDMWPNRSQANPVVDPAPQGPRYLRVVENVLPTVVNGEVTKAVSGLAAYLLVTVDAGAGNVNPSPAEAKSMADALIAIMRAGGDLEIGDINGALAAVVVGTGIVGTGASTATVNNILQILGGAPFTVPAGVAATNTFQLEAGQSNLFTAFHSPIVFEDSSFWISLAQGDLSGLKSYRTVNGVVLDPYVVVYSGTGVAQ
jgi:hypothetical protein